MKKCVWILLLAVSLTHASAAQERGQTIEVVNLSSSASAISAIEELPAAVQSGISSIISTRMGNVADGLMFTTGEVVHLKSIRGTGTPADSMREVPMYDLRFQLNDTTPGTAAYALELRVDDKGRLLFINWPAIGYSDRSALAEWPSVLSYATHFAKLSKFYTSHYQVQLRYNAARDKMVWVFQYPVKDISRVLMLRTIEVDWLGPVLVKQYMGRY